MEPGEDNAPASGTYRAMLFVGAFLPVWLVSAWCADDAYITFRVVENVHAGLGPVWDPRERVQVFTHPLWFGLLVAGRLVVSDPFVVAMLLSCLCTAGTLALLARDFGSAWPRLLVVWATLVSSKAFVDYTSSGLENPLAYLLLVLFIGAARDERHAHRLPSMAALLLLTRLDFLLILAPVLARVRWRWGRAVAAPAAMLLAWFTSATVYYGTPLPNTFWAKLAVAVPLSWRLDQSAVYLGRSLMFDPLTLVCIAAAMVVGWRQGGVERLLAAGLIAYVSYVVLMGGDFLVGRFLAVPFIGAICILAEAVPAMSRRGATVAVLALSGAQVMLQSLPLNYFHSASSAFETRRMVADGRGHSIKLHGGRLLGYETIPTPARTYVAPTAEQPLRVVEVVSVGQSGFRAPPSEHLLDTVGLTDFVIARVANDDWAIGHFKRTVPIGYSAALATGENVVKDEHMRVWVDHVWRITRGTPLTEDWLRSVFHLHFVEPFPPVGE